MFARTLFIPALTLLALTASAQQSRPSLPTYPITAPVRDGGTLHLATHTWTRHAPQAALSPSVIYDNTCFYPAFEALTATQTLTDEGRVPSPTSPPTPSVTSGCNQSYSIEGLQFAYCTDQHTLDVQVAIIDAYASCTSAVGLPTASAFAVGGLPGTSGTNQCWIVTLDLGGAGLAFPLQADGDGNFGGPTPDTFGFEFSMPSLPAGSISGPILAGDPSTCAFGAGTIWSSVSGAGTGLGSLNQFRIDDTAGPSFCATVAPPGFASIYLSLFATDPCAICSCNIDCAGDGSSGPCPCGNYSVPGANQGCVNSTGLGASIAGSGPTSVSNDHLLLTVQNVPPTICLFFQGSSLTAHPFFDGLQCAGSPIVRLGAHGIVAGGSSYPQGSDLPVSVRGLVPPGGGTRYYQGWYRNPSGPCGTAANFSNGLRVFWMP